MFSRCREPGCPSDCGTRTRPSCTDRLLYYALLIFLAAAFVLSVAMGMRWAGETGSGGVPEAPPIARAEQPELAAEPLNHGAQGVRGHRHR